MYTLFLFSCCCFFISWFNEALISNIFILNSDTLFEFVKLMWNVQYLSISFNKSFFQNILLIYVQRRTIKNPRALQTLQIRKFKTTFLVRYLEKKL